MMLMQVRLEGILQASEGLQVGVLMNKTEDLEPLTCYLHHVDIIFTSEAW